MTNKKSLTNNYFYSILYQLVVITIPIVLVPFIAATLTPDGEGIFSLTQAVVVYFSLFSMLGTQIYGSKKIAALGDNIEERRKVFWELFTLKVYTTIASALILVVISFFLEHQIIILIQGMFLIANLLDITWFFSGLEEFKMLAIRNSMIRIASLALILVFVRTPDDVWKYALITVSCEILGQGIMWFEVKKHQLFKKDFKFSSISYFEHLKESFIIFLPQTILLLYSNISISLLGFMISEDQVSFYSLPLKIINAFLVLITALGTVMIPRVSKLHLDNEKDKIIEIFKKIVNLFTYIALPMCVGFIFISPYFVPMFLGERYLDSILVLSILSLKLIFASYSNIIAIQYIVPTNQNRLFVVSALIGLIVNVALGIVFIYMFESLGAAIITVITEFIVLICFLLFTRKQIPFIKFILSGYKSFIATIVMALTLSLIWINAPYILEFIGTYVESQRFIYLGMIIIQVPSAILVYLLVSLLLKIDIQKELFSKLISLVRPNKKEK